MKTVAYRLSKLNLKTIKVSYSPTYNNFLVNHIAINPAHPLYITQKRRQNEHKKEGLWWHATNGTDISKSGCVRTWARRRLRQAFVEELKAKGYDETGKLVDSTAMQDRRDVVNVLRLGRSVDLVGSLRMHGVGPLLPAKFETVKADVRGLIEALVQSSVDNALGFAGEGEKSSGLGQRSMRAGLSAQHRKTQQKRREVVTATANVAKKKPDSAVVDAAKELLRIKPQVSPQPRRARNAPDGPSKINSASPTSQTISQATASKASPRSRRLPAKLNAT